MGKDSCGHRPIGYKGRHSTHLELSCEVLDAIIQKDTCHCRGFVGGKITERGHAIRYVDVTMSAKRNSVGLQINDLRRQFYFALPEENKVTVDELYQQITGFLSWYCLRYGIQFRLEGIEQPLGKEDAGGKRRALNGSSSDLSEELRALIAERDAKLLEIESLRKERDQSNQQLEFEKGERFALEQLSKETVQKLSERIRRLAEQQNEGSAQQFEIVEREVVAQSTVLCNHVQIIDHMLVHVRQNETTVEILELVDLFKSIRFEDEAKAAESFQALKVHLDACDNAREELYVSREELEARSCQILLLEQELAKYAETDITRKDNLALQQVPGSLDTALHFYTAKTSQLDREISRLSAYDQECALAEEATLAAEQQLESLRTSSAPQLKAISKAAEAGDLDLLDSCIAAFGIQKEELKALEKAWNALLQRTVTLRQEFAGVHEKLVEYRQQGELAAYNRNIIQAALLLLGDIVRLGSVEAHWQSLIAVDGDLSIIAIKTPEPVVATVMPDRPIEQAPITEVKQWKAELLQFAQGLPLCLLFPEKSFVTILGKNEVPVERRQRYRDYVAAGLDVAWLLGRMKPGKVFDDESFRKDFDIILQDKESGRMSFFPKRSVDVIVAGLVECKVLDRKNRVEALNGPLLALLKTRDANLRRWTAK